MGRQPDAAGAHILVVEDSAPSRHRLGLMPGMVGYRIDVARDRLADAEAAERRRDHLVLMDLALPGMDG